LRSDFLFYGGLDRGFERGEESYCCRFFREVKLKVLRNLGVERRWWERIFRKIEVLKEGVC